MIRSITLNYYLSKEFLKTVLNISLVFFCLGLVINLFEEINFFKDYENIGIFLPILLSLLFVPSLVYNMFPFIILLSGMWFFLQIKKTDEITAMKISGTSNFSIILIPAFMSIFLGIFFVSALNPVTSALVKKYEATKGSYEKDQDYLAAITENGIWIKEKQNIIRSTKLSGNNLLNVTIYKFDNENNFSKRIESEIANIVSSEWILKNVKVIDKDGNILEENISDVTYKSIYDSEKIKSLYANLDTISFWALPEEIDLLEDRGYSTSEMRSKLQQTLAFPFFLLSMVLLSGVITLGIQTKTNALNHTFTAIIACVFIFYFNRFSAALGKTDKLPIEVSVWMPVIIIFIISAVGLIHANQK